MSGNPRGNNLRKQLVIYKSTITKQRMTKAYVQFTISFLYSPRLQPRKWHYPQWAGLDSSFNSIKNHAWSWSEAHSQGILDLIKLTSEINHQKHYAKEYLVEQSLWLMIARKQGENTLFHNKISNPLSMNQQVYWINREVNTHHAWPIHVPKAPNPEKFFKPLLWNQAVTTSFCIELFILKEILRSKL